jgi:hypothetical protein
MYFLRKGEGRERLGFDRVLQGRISGWWFHFLIEGGMRFSHIRGDTPAYE